jgi:hypothetical protein
MENREMNKFLSYIRSTSRITEGFQKTFDYLKTRNPETDAAEMLWRTSHKMVVRYEVPAEFAPGQQKNYQVVWKKYYEKRFFRYFFRPSLAFREWEGFQKVAACGIPVGKVLAAAEKRCGVRLKYCTFATEFIPCTGDGDDFMPNGCRRNDPELLREFAEKNLRLLAKLHRAGLVHGGFTPRNELYTLKPATESLPGDRMEVVWIDLATCRRYSPLTRKKRQIREVQYFISELRLSPEEAKYLQDVYFAAQSSDV